MTKFINYREVGIQEKKEGTDASVPTATSTATAATPGTAHRHTKANINFLLNMAQSILNTGFRHAFGVITPQTPCSFTCFYLVLLLILLLLLLLQTTPSGTHFKPPTGFHTESFHHQHGLQETFLQSVIKRAYALQKHIQALRGTATSHVWPSRDLQLQYVT